MKARGYHEASVADGPSPRRPIGNMSGSVTTKNGGLCSYVHRVVCTRTTKEGQSAKEGDWPWRVVIRDSQMAGC